MAWKGSKPTAFLKVVEDDLIDKRKSIMADALQAVVIGSPVKDGVYRANHRVTLDGEDLGYDLQATDKAGTETLNKGLAVVGQIDTPYGYSAVQNNIPYGTALENGHSQMAANGVYGPGFEAVRAKYSK